jgi:hypothetical protein
MELLHDVTGTTITASNVIAQMGAVVDSAVANAPAILGTRRFNSLCIY